MLQFLRRQVRLSDAALYHVGADGGALQRIAFIGRDAHLPASLARDVSKKGVANPNRATVRRQMRAGLNMRPQPIRDDSRVVRGGCGIEHRQIVFTGSRPRPFRA